MATSFRDGSPGRPPDESADPIAPPSPSTDLTRLGELIELVPVAVVVRTFDDNRIVYWSRGAEEMYGWSRQEALGQITHSLLQTRFPVSKEDVVDALRQVGRWEGELVHTRRDGASVVVVSQQAVQLDEQGRPSTIVEINTDITHRKKAEEDFRDSEERFRLLVQSVKDYAIFLLSPEGRVISWNEGAQRLKGYRPEEILGQSFTRFYTPEDIERGIPGFLLQQAATDGRVSVEGWRVRKDGSRFWADLVLTALRDDQDQLRGFAKVTRDLTERKQAEEARARASREEGARAAAEAAQAEIQASRNQLAAILTGVVEGITVQDATGRLVFANDAAARLCGFPSATSMLAASRAEILNRFQFFDEAGQPFSAENLPGRRLFRGEPVTEILLRFRLTATGEDRWSLVNAAPIRDDTGRIQLAVNIFHDVTERRRSEQNARFLAAASMELTRSLDYEQTLRDVARLAVPTLADWCVVDILDEDGELRRLAAAHADPAKARLAEELTQRYPTDPSAEYGVRGVLRTGKPELLAEITDAQLEAGAVDAEHFAILVWLQIRSAICVPLVARGQTLGAITLVQAESGRRYGPPDLVVVEDLAGRAALAIDNARLYREAQQQTTKHLEVNAALQDTLRTRDEFLASASHDLKNPLASIKGITQLLHRRLKRPGGLEPERLEQELTRIDRVATRASAMVEELLDVARLQMGRPLDLDRRPADLVALTREIVAEHQERSERHRFKIEVADPELVGLWDSRRLARSFGNLLENALKYSPDGGEIRVHLAREAGPEGWVVLTVEDEGIGIPPEDLERVFDRFQRGTNVGEQIPGTGLGLASVRQIVESHGGTIAAKNGRRGAIFTIRLPPGSADRDH